MQNPKIVQKAAEIAARLLGRPASGAIGIALGTGLDEKALGLSGVKRAAMADIPGYPPPTVHEGAQLLYGELSGAGVLVLSGRAHLYEGYGPDQAVMGVRLLHALGARTVILTNASGALNRDFTVGRLMLIADQLNFTGMSPLTGPNHEAWGTRFPDMSRMYAAKARAIARREADRLGIVLEEGVYAGVTGPQLETPAEAKALRLLGADAVGMSTVLEAIAARHLGMEVLGLSCLANKNPADEGGAITHQDVVAAVKRAEGDMCALLGGVCAALAARER